MKRAALLIAVLVVSGMATAQDGSDDAGVDVTVSKVTNVDINPTQLNYGTDDQSLEPRDFKTVSDNNEFPGIQVENSGSNNITQLSVETSEPLSRPFGSGLSEEYDAGNFIKMRPASGASFDLASPGGDGTIGGTVAGEDDANGDTNTDQTGYHYAARVDFNASGSTTGTPQALTYIDVQNADFRYGRFRDGDEEFFWAVETGAGGDSDDNICDDGARLRVGNDPHTDSEIGTTDFTNDNSGNYGEFTLNTEEGSNQFGITDGVELNTSEGNTSYTVLSWCGNGAGTSTAGDDTDDTGVKAAENQTFLVRTRYDRAPFTDLGGGVPGDYPSTTESLTTTTNSVGGLEALIETSEGTGAPMHPGDSFTLFTSVEIPRGVASGAVGPGTMSLVASSPDGTT